MKKIGIFTAFAALVSFSSCEEEDPAVLGCTDMNAINYNTSATQNDGSCTYIVPGCTDAEALNYNANATQDDGSCEYPASWAGTYDASEDCEGGWTWEQVVTSNESEITLVNAFDWGFDITVPVDGNAFSVEDLDGMILSTDANGVETESQVVYSLISGQIDGESITMHYTLLLVTENGDLEDFSDCFPTMTMSTGGLRYSVEKRKL